MAIIEIGTNLSQLGILADTANKYFVQGRWETARTAFQDIVNIGYFFYEANSGRDPDEEPNATTTKMVESILLAVNGLAFCNRKLKPLTPSETERIKENNEELLMWGYDFARSFKSVRALQSLGNKAVAEIEAATKESSDKAQMVFLHSRFVFSQIYEICNNLLHIDGAGAIAPSPELSDEDLEVLIKLAAGTLNSEGFVNLLLAELYADPARVPGTRSLGFLSNLETAKTTLALAKGILNERPLTGDNGRPSYSILVGNIYSNSALAAQLEIEHHLNPGGLNYKFVTETLGGLTKDLRMVTDIFTLAEVPTDEPNFLTMTKQSLESEIRNRMIRTLIILGRVRAKAKENNPQIPDSYLIQEGMVLSAIFAWSPQEILRQAESMLAQDNNTQDETLHMKSVELLNKAKCSII